MELAVLSAVAHGEHDVTLEAVMPALHALACGTTLDDEHRRIYHDMILAALGGAAKTALEELMSQRKYEYQSDFARRYVAEGKAEGEAKGKAEGKAEDLLNVLAARGIEVDTPLANRVRACTDRECLDRWIRRAAVATRTAEVFDDG